MGCRNCGAEVIQKSGPGRPRTYCSDKCSRAWWRAQRPTWDRSPRVCAYCGEMYDPTQPGRQFCSRVCQSRSGARRWQIKQRYGLTEEEYDTRMAEQDYRCAICGVKPLNPSDLGLDHDHETGAVREFLCDVHNSAIGLFADDPDLLRRAAAYLDKHHQQRLKLVE